MPEDARPARRTSIFVIRVYLAEGNWGAAMQHYQDYQRKLRRELNLAPTTAMDELMRPLIASHTP